MKSNRSSSKIKSRSLIEYEASRLLRKKYKSDVKAFNLKVINNIIYNEKSRLVAIFKDFLIYDDISEFFRRYYTNNESRTRLPKIIDFYEAYSKIFPNYIIIPESRYLYKNIRRKQKMIDAFNQIKMEDEENRKNNALNNVIKKKKEPEKFFDSQIRNSILKYKPSYYNHDSKIQKSLNESNEIYINSVNNSINFNKNIVDNEESILSIANILNSMENKNTEKKFEKATEPIGSTIKNHTKKRLKTILADNLFKGKNPSTGLVSPHLNINNNTNHRLKLKLNSNNNLKNDKPITTVTSENNINYLVNTNSNTITASKSTIPNQSVKTIIKKLPLKQLNLHQEETLSPMSTKNTHITQSEKPAESDRKGGTHRISSSIPELYNSIKIINNYPNIIIPNGSTHVSINQNYYNCGNGQERIIIIDNIDNYNRNSNYNNTNRINIEVKGNSVTNPENEKLFMKSDSNSPHKVRRTKTLTKEGSKQASTVFNSNTNNKLKTIDIKSYNFNTNPQANNCEIPVTCTSTNLISESDNNEMYSTVLKIFKEKYKAANTAGNYKTINNSKKLLERVSSREQTEQGSKNTDNLKYEFKKTKSENINQDCGVYLETQREIKSKLNNELYKAFIKKNKFECLTARNSQEKNSSGKILKNEYDSKIGIDTNINKANINSQTKNYLYKKDLYLSPTPSCAINTNLGSTIKNKKGTSNIKKAIPIIGTPVKFITSKNKVISTEPSEAREESSYNFNQKNLKRKEHSKGNYNSQLETINLSNGFNSYNNYKLTQFSSAKVLTARNKIKTSDIHSIKNLKH